MSLARANLRAPTTKLELKENINRMLGGKPFWSIAPVELEVIPEDICLGVFDRLPANDSKFEERNRDNVVIKEVMTGILGATHILREEYNDHFDIFTGIFKLDPTTGAFRPHMDTYSRGKGYRATARIAIAAFPGGTMSFEGPTQLVNKTGRFGAVPPTPKLIIKSIGSGDFEFVPLDGQEATAIGSGVVAVMSECSIHMAPPETNDLRWFAQQQLVPTDFTA